MGKILWTIALVVLISSCASLKYPDAIPWTKVKVSSLDQVQGCEYVNEFDASSGTISDAKKRIRIYAGREKVTNIVWNTNKVYEPRQPATSGNNNVNVNLNLTNDIAVANQGYDRRGRLMYNISAKGYVCNTQESTGESPETDSEINE